MTLCESKSDINILDINNIIDSFTHDFKKSYNAVKYDKKYSEKTNLDNGKTKEITKRPNENSFINGQPKNKPINQKSTPVEFYYEFQDYIKGEKQNKTNKKKENKYNERKELNNKTNDMPEINILPHENVIVDDISELNNDKEKKGDENEISNNCRDIGTNKNNSKSERNLLMKNNKKNKKANNSSKIIYRNEDRFWNKVKHYIDLKNEHLNELTYRYKMNTTTFGDYKTSKRLNKSSVLLHPKGRKPLYPYQTNSEDFLSKNFDNFYKLYQKEQKVNPKLYKRKNNMINDLNNNTNFNQQKFQEFYEKKMNWIKNRDDKINIERNMLEEKNEQFMNSFSFKPHIDKKSIQLINKRNSFINFMEKIPNTERNYENMMVNKKEIYQKYLATVKPFMAYQYENNSPFLKKKSRSFTRRKPAVDIGMIHINKGKNIVIIKEKKKTNINGTNNANITNNNSSIKLSEKKKNNYMNKKNIFNIFKPDKKHLENNKITNVKNNINKNRMQNGKTTIKNKIWQYELKQNYVKKEKQKLDHNDLYKVNVRDNCSWNKVCINKIFSKPRDKEVIHDFI